MNAILALSGGSSYPMLEVDMSDYAVEASSDEIAVRTPPSRVWKLMICLFLSVALAVVPAQAGWWQKVKTHVHKHPVQTAFAVAGIVLLGLATCGVGEGVVIAAYSASALDAANGAIITVTAGQAMAGAGAAIDTGVLVSEIANGEDGPPPHP